MSTNISFEGDGWVRCPECKKPAHFIGFDEEEKAEEYRCEEGHVTLIPEVK